ncbi:MAG: hypothetical protein F6J90_29560 [Moorea sp. SIOASIH]|uniref:hypothetical protein n=1 Tax=Moorena sp. SIOASIH TaxID=2607817 RepID=UPI0013B9662F|nr:hypothetical protein [Moorena sp. SIOASIH]NEO40269.1 hypothetical protein [Moorena sp. SIOASIH]
MRYTYLFSYARFPMPGSLFPVPCSLLPAPCSLLPAPCSLLPKTQNESTSPN